MKALCCGAMTAWKKQNEAQRKDAERKCSCDSGHDRVQHIVRTVSKLLFTAALLLNSQDFAPMQGSTVLI